MNSNILSLISQITEKRNLIDYRMPFPDEVFDPLREDLIVEWICTSNSLEGNSLNVDDTKTVLSGITVGGKTIDEHLAVINYKKAIDYIENITNDGRELSEDIIKNTHELLFENIDVLNSGMYRKSDIKLPMIEERPISYTLIQSEMNSLIKWYHSFDSSNPVVRCSMLHGKFVNISPFSMGNMKVSLLLLNSALINSGLVPIVIHEKILNEYIGIIKNLFHKNNYDNLSEFIAREVNEQLDSYIQLLL